MEKVEGVLPKWISRQASLGPNVEVNGKYTIEDKFWYCLTLCCPLIFEKYAVVLHPFWINDIVKKRIEAGLLVNENSIEKYDFKSLNWTKFFFAYGKNFDLNTASNIAEEIRVQLLKEKWPEYVWFPAEGDIENEQLIGIRNVIEELHGNSDANYYYCLLKTTAFENEIIYKGKLSELEDLWVNVDVRDNPTAMFPDSKDWCVVTDFDLDITFVGGSARLIEKLVQLKELDIFSIEPKFAEKK